MKLLHTYGGVIHTARAVAVLIREASTPAIRAAARFAAQAITSGLHVFQGCEVVQMCEEGVVFPTSAVPTPSRLRKGFSQFKERNTIKTIFFNASSLYIKFEVEVIAISHSINLMIV